MSHDISRVNGIDEAFYANEPAWHKLGQVVKGTKTSKEAIKLAHLDWEVEQFPVVVDISKKDDLLQTTLKTDKVGNVRTDINRCLGVVGKGYRPVQNWEAFSFLDSIVSDGNLQYESAGALRGGKMIWLLAKFPEDFWVTDDDPSRDYILLANTHDGSSTLQIIPTNIRVVCWNTLSYAVSQAINMYKTRHTENIMARTKMAMEVLGIMKHSQQEMQVIMKKLASQDVNTDYVTNFIDTMFPKPVVDPKSSHADIVLSRWNEKKSIVIENFESVDITKATKNTRYGLLQAVTRYVDHTQRVNGKSDIKKAENKFKSIFFADGAKTKRKALNLLQAV